MADSTIVMCSSAAFYAHVNEVAGELREAGFNVVAPGVARTMAERGDYDVTHYKTWFGNADDYIKKAAYMREHFDELMSGDAVLVINDEKHGKPNYIGPNVLLEMSLAWYHHKPIYLLYDMPADSPFEEEIKGMAPIALHGDLSILSKNLKLSK